MGHTIAEKYRVRGLLGTGGMGSVFEAEEIANGRLVAIKVLNPAQAQNETAIKRFHQEAWAAGAIGHPNLCAVFDVGKLSDGSPYLVMERLHGETLQERLERERSLPVQEVVDVVRQVLAGLGAAHKRGVLHRDIKPENVFLAEQAGFARQAKLLDFGVSKILDDPATAEWSDQVAVTQTGIVMGTPYYLSPEQAQAARDLDARADLYACGVLLYEALTGERPFDASHYDALLFRILHGNPTPPSKLRASISPELERVILKAMAKDRRDRYPTAAELSLALQAATSPPGAPVGDPPPDTTVDPLPR